MNHNQIYNPYHKQPAQPSTEDRIFRRAAATVGVLLLAMFVAHFSGCVAAENEAQASATAFYPSKPSHAQQVAYREDEREQLRLRQLIAQK